LGPSALAATDAATEVQRLQQQRTQQELELQLRMQQQQDRATAPARAPGSDVDRRQLEIGQQQRQRQIFDEQSRAAIAAPPVPGGSSPDTTAGRAAQSDVEQLQRFETERRVDSQRSRGAPPVGTNP
jgi:hypothetical protein